MPTATRWPASTSVLLRALRARRFEVLDAWLDEAQAALESDWHKEYWVSDALGAFDQPNPALKPLLDAWVEARPDSWAAHAARGAHQIAIGWRQRGYAWARETPPENFEAMMATHQHAAPDLVRALRLNPRAITVYTDLLWVGMVDGAPWPLRRRVLDEALARCPDCIQARVAFMVSLEPRWCGAYPLMALFAAESVRSSVNPRMRVLERYADLDRCSMIAHDGNRPAALASCEAIARAGDYEPFLLARAELLSQLGHAADALPLLDRALALRPQDRHLLRLHARVLQHQREFQRYAADVALLRELDPVDGLKPGDVAWAAQGLSYQAYLRNRTGRHQDAVSLLRQTVAMQPDDRDAHLRLDAALVRAGRLPEIVPIWDRYLARHPHDARAYLERAGAQHHLGREQEAQNDLAQACRLGEPQACALQLRNRR